MKNPSIIKCYNTSKEASDAFQEKLMEYMKNKNSEVGLEQAFKDCIREIGSNSSVTFYEKSLVINEAQAKDLEQRIAKFLVNHFENDILDKVKICINGAGSKRIDIQVVFNELFEKNGTTRPTIGIKFERRKFKSKGKAKKIVYKLTAFEISTILLANYKLNIFDLHRSMLNSSKRTNKRASLVVPY